MLNHSFAFASKKISAAGELILQLSISFAKDSKDLLTIDFVLKNISE